MILIHICFKNVLNIYLIIFLLINIKYFFKVDLIIIIKKQYHYNYSIYNF